MSLPHRALYFRLFFLLSMLFSLSACGPAATVDSRSEAITLEPAFIEPTQGKTATAKAAAPTTTAARSTPTATLTPPLPSPTPLASPVPDDPQAPVQEDSAKPEPTPISDQYTYAMTFGGPGYEEAAAIRAVSSGGSVIGGSYSLDGSGDNDPWIIRLDPYGVVLWQFVYAGAKSDSLSDLRETSDGGFILAGSSSSPAKNSFDMLIVKLEKDGKVGWQKQIGGLQNEFAYAVCQTRDGGYILAGETSLFYPSTQVDAWIVRFDRSGKVTWQRSYGGAKNDRAFAILETELGDLVFAGMTESFGGRNANGWVVKLDSRGDLIWQFAYGGDGSDNFNSIQLSKENGLILGGHTTGDNFFNDSDVWVVQLQDDGSLAWSTTYGGAKSDKGADLEISSDGGFILTGFSEFEGYLFKLWALKLDRQGQVAWSRTFGLKGINLGEAAAPAPDGGFLVAGISDSLDAGGWSDVFLLKLNRLGEIPGCQVAEDFSSYEFSEVSVPVTASNAAYKTTLIDPVGGPLSPRPAPYQSSTICTYPEVPPTPTPTPTTDPQIPPFSRKLYLQSPAMSGDDVRMVQERLLALGYREAGSADGYFGKMTDQAVRHFQEVNGLVVDGIIGEMTWTLLFSAAALGPT